MKQPFLVTLYFSLASILGLGLSVIGATMLINLLVTTYIIPIPRYPSMPPTPYMDNPTRIKQLESQNAEAITDEDRAALESWNASYEQWKTEQAAYDKADVPKKNQLATSISMLVVGIPVLWFHLRELRKK